MELTAPKEKHVYVSCTTAKKTDDAAEVTVPADSSATGRRCAGVTERLSTGSTLTGL